MVNIVVFYVLIFKTPQLDAMPRQGDATPRRVVVKPLSFQVEPFEAGT